MGYKRMLKKSADILAGIVVISFGVAVYEQKLYGLAVAVYAYLIMLAICHKLGD